MKQRASKSKQQLNLHSNNGEKLESRGSKRQRGRSGEVGDKRDYSGAGEGVTNRVPNVPFRTICRSEVTNRVGE